ncbi:MAG: ABC transporter substrate-binding protein [Synergistaceae bacterium]|nr:ABC transporter substrate-binding protein [Synergistaceae bacterium]
MRAITLIIVSVLLTLAVAVGANVLLEQIDRGIPVALIFEEEGPGAALGQGLKQTLLRVIDDCREQKVARYHPIVLSPANVEGSVQKAVEAGAVAVLGGGTSTFTGKLLLAAEKERISLISPTANSRRLAVEGDRLYRIRSSTGARRLGRVAADQGFTDYIVLADQDNYQYVDSFLPDFIEAHGEEPLAVMRLRRGLDREEIIRLLDSRIRFRGALLVLPDFYASLTVQLLRDFWPGLTIYLSDWGVSGQSMQLMGTPGPGVRGISFSMPEGEDHLGPLVERLTERYGSRPVFDHLASAHAALAMLDQAVQKGGPVRGGVAAALSAMDRVDHWGWNFAVDCCGDGRQPIYLVEFLQGRWQTVEVLPPLPLGGP